MNNHIVLLLAIGLSIADATSVLKEIVNEKSLQAETNESITRDETSSNISENEQNGNEFSVITDESDKYQTNYEEPLDIFMENLENPTKEVFLEESVSFDEFNSQDPSDAHFDEIVPVTDSDYSYNDIINRDPNEIMDTAAGFVPIPIFKRRQKPRKQVAARRRFRKPYPYRRLYYYYPYYSYYRPSSLRFYY
ncbi:uncharacterized protein LOC126773912 [Nymphalis io]|uniref:uncharacterized protein LOC126773912 n=1 Tax=Inachis io TaxID=171585 RepID=UPI0021675127|nr:uncharacterized protein LOC126773912 [Nymphalis io]XP_050351126.1 uncharacterized protein LOC126773912 [Nymphalis io]